MTCPPVKVTWDGVPPAVADMLIFVPDIVPPPDMVIVGELTDTVVLPLIVRTVPALVKVELVKETD